MSTQTSSDKKANVFSVNDIKSIDAGIPVETLEKMCEMSTKMMDFAYIPYSQFKVGACILASNGKLYGGCNVENQSYGLTNCAERTAVFKMYADETRNPAEKMYIKGIWVSTKPGVSCCGACRQVLMEMAPPETRNFPIILHSTDKNTALLTSIQELLPFGGDLDSLKKE